MSRDSWSGHPYPVQGLSATNLFANSRAQREHWWNDPDKPNSHCPMCGEPVWFFRNRNGGCAYFDALGKPWPLHPCMALQQGMADRQAATEAVLLYDDPSASIRKPSGVAQPGLSESSQPISPYSGAKEVTESASAMRTPARSYVEQVPQTAIEDQVLSWWTALSALVAAAVILFVAASKTFPAGLFGTVLLVWLFIVPFAVLMLALALFLVRVPPPRSEGNVFVLVLLKVLVLVPLGVVGSVVTLGIGPAALGVRVISEIPWAQAAASSSSYPSAIHRNASLNNEVSENG